MKKPQIEISPLKPEGVFSPLPFIIFDWDEDEFQMGIGWLFWGAVFTWENDAD